MARLYEIVAVHKHTIEASPFNMPRVNNHVQELLQICQTAIDGKQQIKMLTQHCNMAHKHTVATEQLSQRVHVVSDMFGPPAGSSNDDTKQARRQHHANGPRIRPMVPCEPAINMDGDVDAARAILPQ